MSTAAASASETVEAIVGFAGGANTAAAPNQLKKDQCLGLANIVLDEAGGGRKRRGMTEISNPGEIISIYVFYRGAGVAPQVITHTLDGKLQYSTDDGGTWGTIMTGVSTTNPMCFETFNDKLYMVNGVDGYLTWTGSTAAAIPANPNGKFLKVWKDTMWVAGTDDDRVWSSDPGNADVFTVGNWVDLGKGDGDTITGLSTDGNVLIVPKRRRGFLIYDPTTFANRIFDPDKGCEGHFSFVHYGENLYYMTREGIVIYLGDSPSQIISANIDPIFQADILNFEYTWRTWAYTHNNRIGWSVPELGTAIPQLQIELLPRVEAHPFTFHRMPARCFTTLRHGTKEILLSGKNGTTKLCEAFRGGTDAGVAFVGVIETRWFDMDNPMQAKYLRRLLLNGRGQFFVGVLLDYEAPIKKTISIDLSSIDAVWDEAGDVWGDENWGPGLVLESVQLHPDVYGKVFKFRFSDQSLVEGTQVIDVADIDYRLARGAWALNGGILHGIIMGSDL